MTKRASIEGSTKLWEQHSEAMRAALTRHDYLLRQAIEANNGAMVKSTGDGVLAAFATAPDGLAAALALQPMNSSIFDLQLNPIKRR